MHILFLSDNFPPEVNAPASRTYEHCSLWAAAGHRVSIVTCAPNFPTGQVFGGYRNRLWQRESTSGMEVIRVWTYMTANTGFVRRILDYLSFMFTATLAGLLVRDVDVVVSTSPQFFAACAGHAVAFMKRRPFVFELRDLWPDSIRAVGAMRDSVFLDLMEKVEMYLYRRARLIVSVTHSFRDVLAKRGIDPGKIVVVTNGVDLARFSPRGKDAELQASLGLQGAFVSGYVGTHGMAHGLETVLLAAQRLASLPGGERHRILLLGDGAEKVSLKAQAAQLGLRNVIFLDSVAKDQVVRYWSLLDIAIIHLRKSPLFETVIPSKLFECMGMGIPVVLGVGGEAARIVEQEDIGVVVEPQNADALAEGIDRLANDPEQLSRIRNLSQSAALKYDRSALAHRMLAEIERLATQGHSTSGGNNASMG